MTTRFALALTAVASVAHAPAAHAVEGGIGAYFIGSRDSFAGLVPPPGTYTALTFDHLQGTIDGVSIGGLPIRAKTDLTVNLLRLSVTQALETEIFGGRPAVNLTLPFPDISIAFTALTPPLAGDDIEDSTFGLGDIVVTPLLGWTRGKLSYSAALSVYAPTGSYETATVDVPDRTVDVLSNGKNVWSFQPVVAATWFNPETGIEFSGAASMLFATKNTATDYQTAAAVQLEGAVLQHLKSGWAFGATAYHYEQIDDDSGSGADGTRTALGVDSLRARVSGAGPIVIYSGGTLFGGNTSFKLKYVTEFNARRRFENDVVTVSMALAF